MFSEYLARRPLSALGSEFASLVRPAIALPSLFDRWGRQQADRPEP